jgi:hypothetical protein
MLHRLVVNEFGFLVELNRVLVLELLVQEV